MLKMRSLHLETPPRAWGRPHFEAFQTDSAGNTPTGVGKTHRAVCMRGNTWKHPHGRGEDPHARTWGNSRPETPPRAWGRQSACFRRDTQAGNTPTGVGKTQIGNLKSGNFWKHPHGRGEDNDCMIMWSMRSETPPRAWGRHSNGNGGKGKGRNTPTGVGKTAKVCPSIVRRQKHPHGRGEDAASPAPARPHKETPPRAWGRPDRAQAYTAEKRNTPTGVGKTNCGKKDACQS